MPAPIRVIGLHRRLLLFLWGFFFFHFFFSISTRSYTRRTRTRHIHHQLFTFAIVNIEDTFFDIVECRMLLSPLNLFQRIHSYRMRAATPATEFDNHFWMYEFHHKSNNFSQLAPLVFNHILLWHSFADSLVSYM